jgi:hypothetical protein
MTRYTLHRACRVIIPSQSTADDLVVRLKAEKEKLRIISLGVDSNYFTPIEPEAILKVRRGYGWRPTCFFGERRPHKNLTVY